jgi:hypothetical protein
VSVGDHDVACCVRYLVLFSNSIILYVISNKLFPAAAGRSRCNSCQRSSEFIVESLERTSLYAMRMTRRKQ